MSGGPWCLRGVYQVSRAGIVVVNSATGRVDDAAGGLCGLDTWFQAASISKQFVAASIMVRPSVAR